MLNPFAVKKVDPHVEVWKKPSLFSSKKFKTFLQILESFRKKKCKSFPQSNAKLPKILQTCFGTWKKVVGCVLSSAGSALSRNGWPHFWARSGYGGPPGSAAGKGSWSRPTGNWRRRLETLVTVCIVLLTFLKKSFFFHFLLLLKRQPSLLEEALQKMSAIVWIPTFLRKEK